ncbi:MAG: DHH family phosphoesterase [Lachnospiraceae bacterium]|nr:DHH family phosphoesterase [Lachnospiraceae bacterium]
MMNKKNAKGILSLYLQWPIILGAYLILVEIVIYSIDSQAGLIVLPFLIIYIIVALYLKFIKYNNLNSAVLKLAESISNRQRIYFSKIDLPHAVLDTEGRILWANDRFLGISKFAVVGSNIRDTFPDLNKGIVSNLSNEKIDLLTALSDRKYKVHLRMVDLNELGGDEVRRLYTGSEKVIMVYLYDETDYYILKQENDDNKQVTGFIYIDNYYEVAENMEDSKASMLIAMVDRKLTRYISYNSGILKKLEKDKYFFVTTKKDIEDMMDDKFSILEQTKEIIGGDNIPLTLSIGVGYEGKSIESNHELARVAIDMALGRGGDQAVVKRGQETLYFGGKSASNTTNARVRARVKATSFRETLDTKDKVLIMGHKNGDFDSFGACVGVYIMAKHLGKDVHIIINSLTNAVEEMRQKFINSESYDENMFMTGDEAVAFADEETLLIVVDHNTNRISDESRLFDKGLDLVVFDHHRISQNSIHDAILSYIDAGASSTCELVTEIMTYFDDRLKLKPLEADTMLAGIMIDTMYFTFQTSAKTFDAASYLRKRGADSDRVRKMLRVDFDFEKLKNDVVSEAENYRDGYVIAVLENVNENIEESVAKAEIANELINIKDVKASFVITKEDDKYAISSRSIDDVNVQVLMEKLGGGGHRSSAGAAIEAESFEDAVSKVKAVIDEFIREDEK